MCAIDFSFCSDVVTVFAREGALSELLYADYLILMSETIEGFWIKFFHQAVVLLAGCCGNIMSA